jgi:hypothetical protein
MICLGVAAETSRETARVAGDAGTNGLFGLKDLEEELEERIIGKGYLILVRKTFRAWDQGDTADKRRLLVRLI